MPIRAPNDPPPLGWSSRRVRESEIRESKKKVREKRGKKEREESKRRAWNSFWYVFLKKKIKFR